LRPKLAPIFLICPLAATDASVGDAKIAKRENRREKEKGRRVDNVFKKGLQKEVTCSQAGHVAIPCAPPVTALGHFSYASRLVLSAAVFQWEAGRSLRCTPASSPVPQGGHWRRRPVPAGALGFAPLRPTTGAVLRMLPVGGRHCRWRPLCGVSLWWCSLRPESRDCDCDCDGGGGIFHCRGLVKTLGGLQSIYRLPSAIGIYYCL
jgi:hypothetical protein